MGCSCASKASSAQTIVGPSSSTARADPDPRDISLPDSSVISVGLASESLVYCLLVAPGDSAVFVDARPRDAFDRRHLYGSWCVTSMLKAGDVTGEAALQQRCSLRTVIVCGDVGNAIQDQDVLQALQLLRRVGTRPKGAPLVLRGGIPAFARRFGFCLRGRNEETTKPLPACPVEVLPPEWGRPRPLALYLGTEACLKEKGTDTVLGALRIDSAVSLGSAVRPSRKGCKVIVVNAASGEDGAVVVAQNACEKLGRQSVACVVVGPMAALAVALFLIDALPAVLHSADEVVAYVRLRYPVAEFDTAALTLLRQAVVKKRPGDASALLLPSVEPSEPPSSLPPPSTPVPVAPPASVAAQVSYVETVCIDFQKRDRCGAETALNTIKAAFNHVLDKPTDDKFRRLKGSNARVQRELLKHEEALTLLRLAGWIRDGDDYVLPPTTPLQGLRDVLSFMPSVPKVN